MPHSSGGGSSGGGFHGGGTSYGGGGGSRSTIRYSHAYFPGAYWYVYYDRKFNPHIIYASQEHVKKPLKARIITFIILLLVFLVPTAFIICTGIHIPRKLNVNYDTSLVIDDTSNILTDEEEINIKVAFLNFYDKTGITPALETVTPDDIGMFVNLRNYSYSAYTSRFKDEKHWLIVYCNAKENDKSYWAFEGMQGNDTDTILYSGVTTKFNKTFYEDLTSDKGLSESLIHSFETITPHIMDTYYNLEGGAIAFIVIWVIISGILLASHIGDSMRQGHLDSAVKVDENTKLKNCPYCDSPYYTGSVKKCPKCGAILDDGDLFDTKDPEF